VGVLSPERTRPRPASPPPEPPSSPPPPEPRRRGNPWPFLTVLLIVLSLVGGFMWVRGVLPDFDNPFAAQTVDRTQPAVLQSLQDIGEYRAASANYELLVDLEQDTDLPAVILGERTLFIAVGSVDAGVDLRALGTDAVEVSEDGAGVTITLPPADLYEAQLDQRRSDVFERNEGILNRIGNVFSGDGDHYRDVTLAAEERLNEAARANGDLAERAEENTAAMLETLLRSLGFERVAVRFS
jgi:Protein of unknown function (DUF4230)